MSRRQKKKKRSRPARLKNSVAHGYRVAAVTAADKVRMLETAIADAKQAAADLPGQLDRLVAVVKTVHAVEMATTLAGWALMQGVGTAGVVNRSMLPAIEQADVELLQGVMFTVRLEEWGCNIPHPEQLAEVIELLPKIRRGFAIMRMVTAGDDIAPEAAVIRSLQERVRLHTQIVRNWGYFDQVLAISQALYSRVDAGLEAARGVSATDIIGVYNALCRSREEAYTSRFLRMREVMQKSTVKGVVTAYYATHPDLLGSSEEFLASMPADVSRDQVAAMLLAHSDHRMSQCAEVDLDDIAVRTGLTADRVRKAMALTSRVPGSGPAMNLQHLGLGNPVWDHPGMELGTTYVVPVPQVFFSHIHRLMGRLCADAGISKALEQHRADYLEEAVEAAFRLAYPTATMRAGEKWNWNGQQYETDLTVLIDRVLIIAEAKSGKITHEALRGAPDRLKKHVGELVGAPARQATRLEELIRAAAAGDPDAGAVATQLGIVPHELDAIVRVSVTLEDFSYIASLEDELKHAGWLDIDVRLAPTLSLADLQTVFDLLEYPAIIIHYFRLRDRLQKEVTLLGDELDCLGNFLAGALVVPMENGRPLLQITGQSAEVDRYYLNRLAGVATPKPRPRWSAWFTRFLQSLNDRAKPGWTTVALAVLSGVNQPVTEELEREMNRLRMRMVARKSDSTNDSVLWAPKNAKDAPVVYLLYSRTNEAAAHNRALDLAGRAMDRTGRQRCVVVARVIENWDQPYAFYMVLQSADGGSPACAEQDAAQHHSEEP